ncbi:hypothetical protein FA95DRAFT_883740 [Auriscalpium vulgare]|uniref:Uncharacterized protein n=1 Tax=Auriscalpium vulgare TaxID=40419 RepID=A0ACB8R965_9AGAM|nr:hypothetical protein FA95DRAFT_883740 [Auriscalpium vulgare]
MLTRSKASAVPACPSCVVSVASVLSVTAQDDRDKAARALRRRDDRAASRMVGPGTQLNVDSAVGLQRQYKVPGQTSCSLWRALIRSTRTHGTILDRILKNNRSEKHRKGELGAYPINLWYSYATTRSPKLPTYVPSPPPARLSHPIDPLVPALRRPSPRPSHRPSPAWP